MPLIPQTSNQVKEHLRKTTRRFAHDYIEAEMFLEVLGFYDENPVYELNRSTDNTTFDTGISVLMKPMKRAIPKIVE